MADAVTISRGDIVIVERLPDPLGGNPKDRRLIVIDITAGGLAILGVAIAGKSEDTPSNDSEVRLPTGRPYQPSRLGLVKPSVASCGWLAVVRVEDCQHVSGPIPENLRIAITAKIQFLHQHGLSTIVRNDL